jgi:putative ABC transport system permease protein
MQFLWRDIRTGLRSIRRNAGLSIIAIAALALGIGAATSIFSVVDAVLLRPLAYPDSGRLITLWEFNASKGITDLVSPPNFKDWLAQSEGFESMGAHRQQSVVLSGKGLAVRLDAVTVTANLLPMLGARPVIGRTFLPEEEQPGRDRAAILSYSLWTRLYGGDSSVLQQRLTLDGQSYQVVGVLPADFHFLDTSPDLFTVYALSNSELKERGFHTLQVLGKLKPGTSLDQARASLASISKTLESQYAGTNAGWSAKLVPLKEKLTGESRDTLLMLFGAVGLLLLIACANVANLLLAQASGRRKEIAIRKSMGAGGWQLVRQLLVESILLALAGGAAGIALAIAGVKALVHFSPQSFNNGPVIGIDARVLLFALLLSLLTGIVFGLAPALMAADSDLNLVLRSSGRGNTSGKDRKHLRAALVVAEVAVSLVLLVGASLLIHSFSRLSDVNPGFRAEHVVTLSVSLPESRYKGLAVAQFYRELLRRIGELPGVQHAGITRDVPLSGVNPRLNFEIASRPPLNPGEQPRARFRASSAGYFEAMGIPLLRGRFFDRSDTDTSQPAAIINETMAKRYWPNENPLGQRVRSGFEDSPWCTIVGIVGDVKHARLEADNDPEIYYSYLQVPRAQMNFIEGTMTLALRTAGDPAQLTAAVREQVGQIDGTLAVFHVRTMESLVQDAVGAPRFRTWLIGIFAAVSLLLSSIGLYGVIAWSVAQRTNEMGVRMALGAQQSEVMRMVLWHGMKLALLGVGIGLALAALLAKLLEGLLFGVTPHDTVSFVVTSLVLLLVALAASYFPARRATRVDPAVALRAE